MAAPPAIRWHLAPGTIGSEELRELLERGRGSDVKKASHRAVRRVVLGGLDVHVKHYREGLGRWLRAARAEREYDLTREAARRGVPVPEALAWGEDSSGSYLVTRTLADAHSLLNVLAAPLSPALRQGIARALGVFLARAHSAGVRHDDLHPGNLLFRGPGELYLIDLDAVRLGPPLAWPAARDNLVVLNRWLAPRFSHADRFRGWLAYSRAASFADEREGARDLEERTRRSQRRFVAGLDRRCLGGNRHFRRVSAPGRNGYAVTDLDLSGLLADPDGVIDSSTTLKRSDSSAVVVVPVKVEGVEREVILKRVNATAWTDPLAALFRPPPALHAYRMAHALRLRGLPTPRPLAVWHRRRLGLPTDGYLLLDRVPDALALDRFVESLRGRPDEARRLRAVGSQLARTLARMHGWGLSHRDLKAANVLVSPRGWTMGQRGLCESEEDGGDHVWFVDLAGVRRRRLDDDRRARDLARLNLSFLSCPDVSRTMRLRFLRAYLGRESKGWKAWWSRIAGASESKAARNRRNGRPLG